MKYFMIMFVFIMGGGLKVLNAAPKFFTPKEIPMVRVHKGKIIFDSHFPGKYRNWSLVPHKNTNGRLSWRLKDPSGTTKVLLSTKEVFDRMVPDVTKKHGNHFYINSSYLNDLLVAMEIARGRKSKIQKKVLSYLKNMKPFSKGALFFTSAVSNLDKYSKKAKKKIQTEVQNAARKVYEYAGSLNRSVGELKRKYNQEIKEIEKNMNEAKKQKASIIKDLSSATDSNKIRNMARKLGKINKKLQTIRPKLADIRGQLAVLNKFSNNVIGDNLTHVKDQLTKKILLGSKDELTKKIYEAADLFLSHVKMSGKNINFLFKKFDDLGKKLNLEQETLGALKASVDTVMNSTLMGTFVKNQLMKAFLSNSFCMRVNACGKKRRLNLSQKRKLLDKLHQDLNKNNAIQSVLRDYYLRESKNKTHKAK